ncbi:hypothetical protein LTR27_011732 [Elasticomyces elasticus]|nr:hypothetical protein LTR27_011732 [Elasticomyces elasticus]
MHPSHIAPSHFLLPILSHPHPHHLKQQQQQQQQQQQHSNSNNNSNINSNSNTMESGTDPYVGSDPDVHPALLAKPRKLINRRHLFYSAPSDMYTQLTTKVRRRRTANDAIQSQSISDLTNPAGQDAAATAVLSMSQLSGLQNKVLNAIIDRLRDTGMNTAGLTVQSLAWLLPRSTKFAQTWIDLLEDPLLVSEAEIRAIFQLRASTAYSVKPVPGQTFFYVRTFLFSAHELKHILQTLLDEGYEYFIKLYAWLSVLENLADEIIVFLRYIGQTGGRAFDRHYEDVMHSKLGGSFFKSFMQVAVDLYPEVLENVIIQEFTSATIDFAASSSLRDERERVLIALFGDGTLNAVKGGVDLAWEPSSEDLDVIRSVKSTTSILFPGNTGNCSQAMRNDLKSRADEIQQYANEHPATTGTHKYPITDEMRDVVYYEGIPAVMPNGYTAMVTISSDKPVQWAADPKPYFEETAMTASLSQTVFNYLAWVESSQRSVDAQYAKKTSQLHCLPFMDLFPWCGKDMADLPTASALMRDYLRTINSVIVTTHSKMVTSVALSGFAHDAGLSAKTEFVTVVGRPTMSSYHEPGQRPKANDWVVVIPSYHSGFLAHGGIAGEKAGKVFFFTQFVVWVATGEALKLADSDMTKEEICKQVISTVEALTGPETPFGRLFEKHKALFISSWNDVQMKATQGEKRELAKEARAARVERRSQIPQLRNMLNPSKRETASETVSSDTPVSDPKKLIIYSGAKHVRVQSRFRSWHKAKRELNVVLLSGFAHGEPGSQERLAQATAIHEKGIAALQETSVAASKQEFLDWAQTVPKHTSYYFEASSTHDQISEIPNLLRCHITNVDELDHPKWMDDVPTMSQASSDVRMWVETTANGSSTDAEASATVAAAWFDHMKTIDPVVFNASIKETAPPAGRTAVVFDSTQSISGSQVELVAHKEYNSQLRYGLQWRDSSGKTFKLEAFLLPLQNVLPKTATEVRTIHFVPGGIDIRDSSGASVSARPPEKTITAPLSAIVANMQRNPQLEAFRVLWEQQTGLEFDKALLKQTQDDTDDSTTRQPQGQFIPSAFFDTRQEPLDLVPNKSMKYMQQLQALRPLQPGDALWLLNAFLKEKYPNGGDVDTGNPLHFPGSRTVWDMLTVFCLEAKYSKHQYINQLHSMASSAQFGGVEKKYSTTTFKAALEFLRGAYSERTVNGRYTLAGQSKSETARKEVLTISGVVPRGLEDPGEVLPDLVHEEATEFEDVDGAGDGTATGAIQGGDDALDPGLSGLSAPLPPPFMPAASTASASTTTAAPNLPPTAQPSSRKRRRISRAPSDDEEIVKPARRRRGNYDGADDDEEAMEKDEKETGNVDAGGDMDIDED